MTVTDTPSVAKTKWHSIGGGYGVSVAFEQDFSLDVEPNYSDKWLGSARELIHTNPRETLVRAYSPAVTVGDLETEGTMAIAFVPWLNNGHEAKYHRLCFQTKPDRQTGKYQAVAFARFGETKTFGFEPPQKCYIHLNFLGYHRTEFDPVFLKVADGTEFKYFMVSAEVEKNDDGTARAVVVIVEKVDEEEVPDHLKTALK